MGTSEIKFDSLKALDTIENMVKDLGKSDNLSTHMKKVQKIIDFLEKIHNDALLIGFEQGEKSNTLKL